MAMVVIAKEEIVRDVIFDNYRNVAAFTLGKGGSAENASGKEVRYEEISFLPDDDTINGIKNGDLKLKKVINSALEIIHKPNMESLVAGLGIIQLITMITSDRKVKKGIPVIAFITDEEDEARNKILVKFITAILGEFGIKPLTDKKTIKKIFKKRKNAREKVAAYCRKSKNGCNLSQKGVALKKMNYIFYEMELRQSAMNGLEPDDLDKGITNNCIKSAVSAYTATNLRYLKKKNAKQLAKKNKAAVEAYDELRDILLLVNPKLKLPKVKYGQKKKKGKAVGEKMNVKKFKKFFMKKSNRPLLVLVYGHNLCRVMGVKLGGKEYNDYMKSACSMFNSEFVKQYAAAVSAYVKDQGGSSKK